MISGFDAVRAAKDLESKLAIEIAGLTGLVMETAKSNVRYYPEVRNHLERHIVTLAGQMVEGRVTADYWQAWLEQFGKGSLMADGNENPGLDAYMRSETWNTLRSPVLRKIVGRRYGEYRSIDGTIQRSGGSYAGVDLEDLAAQGKIDRSYGPTPPTFFLRVALRANKRRILEGIQSVIDHFPYHKYFKEEKES